MRWNIDWTFSHEREGGKENKISNGDFHSIPTIFLFQETT